MIKEGKKISTTIRYGGKHFPVCQPLASPKYMTLSLKAIGHWSHSGCQGPLETMWPQSPRIASSFPVLSQWNNPGGRKRNHTLKISLSIPLP